MKRSPQSFLESSEYYSKRYRTPVVKMIIPVAAFIVIIFIGSLLVKIDNTIDSTGIVVQNDHYKGSSTLTIESLVSANQSVGVKKGQQVYFNIPATDKLPTSMKGKVRFVMSKPIEKNSHVMYKIRSEINGNAKNMNIIRVGMEGKLSVSIGKISIFNAIKQGAIPK